MIGPEMGGLEAVPRASLPRFDTENVLWWFGAAVAGVGSAVVVFALPDAHHLLWIFFGLLVLNAAYAIVAKALLDRGWAVPGGLFTVLNTVFTIVAFAVLEVVLHLTNDNADPFNHFTWWVALVALFALVAAAFAYARVEFTFLQVIAAGATIALVYLLLPIVDKDPSRSVQFFVAAVLGAILMFGALGLDARGERRTAFWWHLSGLTLLAIGLTHYVASERSAVDFRFSVFGGESPAHHPDWAWILLLLIGFATLFVAGVIERATWVLFGIGESFAVLVHYTDRWVDAQWLVGLILLVIGIGYVKLGLLFRRNTTFWSTTATMTRLGPATEAAAVEEADDAAATASWLVRFYTASPTGNPFPLWDGPNLLWWLGSALMLGATVYLVTLVPTSQRYLWTLLVALGCVVIYAVASRVLAVLGWRIPSGLLVFIAAVFGVVSFGAFEELIGVFPNNSPFTNFCFWAFLLFVVAIICFLFAYGLSQFNFALFGAATSTLITLYAFNPALVGTPSLNNYFLAAIIFGLIFLVIGIRLDNADRRRPAFWWHFQGLLLIAIGLAYYLAKPLLTSYLLGAFLSDDPTPHPDASWAWLVIFLAGVAVLCGAALLHRATWGVWGLIGVFIPAVHYSVDWTGGWRTALVIGIIGLVLMRIGGFIAARSEFWQRLRELPRGPRPTY